MIIAKQSLSIVNLVTAVLHSTKNLGVRMRKILLTNGTAFPSWLLKADHFREFCAKI